VAGTERCDLAGAWGPCSGIGPRPEDCDGRDDDCDSRIDEGACVFEDPIVMCPVGMSAEVLSTVTLSGSGSDPDGGTVTYRWTVTSRPAGSASMPASPTSATTTFFLDAGGTYTLQLCVTDDEGAMACCTVTVTSTVPPRGLHVELQWDTVYGDADVHLLNVTRVAPDGWWTTDDCHYANRTPDWPPAGVAANPTLDRDDTDGHGPENITVDDSPASGTYTVGVHYFCEHSIGAGAAPGSGPTTATVRIYCDGVLIATYGGIDLSSTDDWNTIATVTYPGCRATRVGTTTYGSSLLPASFTTARHCEIPCTGDSDCPPRERCATVVGGGGRRDICILR
jgi:hypothetical protein